MKKVLVFGMTENPGGVESFIMAYYRKLDRSRVQFDFLCNTDEVAYEQEIESLGGRVFRICARSRDLRRYRRELEAFFRQHAQEYCALWVNVCSLANIDYLKAAKKYNIPCRIIHSHNSQNMDSALRGLLHRLNRGRVRSLATDYWACSNAAARWFYDEQLMQSERFRLVVNAIDLSRYAFNPAVRERLRAQLGLRDKLVIGNVGRLHRQKNQEFLLEIFAQLCQKRSDAVLLLVGDGEENTTLMLQATKLGIHNRVRFLGVREDVADLFQAMDLFVFPSRYEGLGIVLIEAQTSGLYCLTSTEGVPQDARVSQQIEYLPLAGGAALWCDRILACAEEHRDRPNTLGQVRQAGFDIDTQAPLLQNFFETEIER